MHQSSSRDRVYFVHRVPRRTRLKVPQRRRDGIFFAELGKRLAACSGVVAVTTAPDAASIVVHHAPEFQWSTVRFEALGLRPADPTAGCRCEQRRADGVELEGLCALAIRLVISGQPLAELAEWAIGSLIRSALSDSAANAA